MKNIYICVSMFFLSMLMFSCSETLDELNTNTARPTDVSLDLALPEAIVSSVFNEGATAPRACGILLQQLFGIDAQQLGYNSYLFGEDLLNNYWRSGLYAGVLRSCQIIIDDSVEQGRPYYGAVAKIIMANEYGKATSYFGDIPFAEALDASILQPQYDTQESVYAGVQGLLDEAISTLNSDASGYVNGDLIFGGDAGAWVKSAHALKARYYLHTSKRTGDYSQAVAQAQMAMASNAENPAFTFETSETANWSLAKFGIERPSTLGVDPRFAALMEGDPRMPVYTYTDGTTWWYFDSPTDGDMVWGQSDATVPMVSYTEMKFIEAEAMAASGGDATQALADAVQASFDLVGVQDTLGYIDALPSATLETVMTEAYKAYYGYNFHETFANWRRTGFPALSPPDGVSGGLNPSGAVPKRFLYVESETAANGDNVAAARASQGGGLLDQPVWAFQ